MRGLCPGCATHAAHGFARSGTLAKAQHSSAGCGQEPCSEPCLHGLAVCTPSICFSPSGANALSPCYDKWAAPGCPQAPPAGPDPEQEGCRAVQESWVPAAPCYSWLFHVGAVRGLPGRSLGEDSHKPGV